MNTEEADKLCKQLLGPQSYAEFDDTMPTIKYWLWEKANGWVKSGYSGRTWELAFADYKAKTFKYT